MKDKLALLQEAERRGILPADKVGLLTEARKRNLIPALSPTPQEPAAQDQSFLSQVVDLAQEMGPGAGELFAGAFQKGAAALGRGDIADRIGQVIEKQRDNLSTGGQVGRTVGKIIATAPLGVGKGLLGLAGAGAATSALEPIVGEGVNLETVGEQIAMGTAASLATGGLLKGVGSASKLAAKGIKKIGDIKGGEELPLPSSILKSQSSKLFKIADDKGGIFKQSKYSDFIKQAEDELIPDSAIGKVLEEGSESLQVLNQIKAAQGEVFDLKGVQALDNFLGDKIMKFTQLNGTVTNEGRKFLNVQNSLRKIIDTAKPQDVVGGKEGLVALKQAKSLWSKSLKLGDVERILAKADLSDNPATVIKSGFRALASNPKRLKGYSNGEVKLIKQAAQSGIIGDTLRTLGSRLIPIGAAVTDGGLASTGIALGASSASRNLAARSQVNRADKIIEEIVNSAVNSTKQPTGDLIRSITPSLSRAAAIQINTNNR
tara:strand:+ start:232 stop:1698 length:1467 start_codon:yes stop_codon:yes gene_type:complete